MTTKIQIEGVAGRVDADGNSARLTVDVIAGGKLTINFGTEMAQKLGRDLIAVAGFIDEGVEFEG